jgi:hypothetical protein
VAGGKAVRKAVIVGAGRAPEIAPLIVEAYGLTDREREITQLYFHYVSAARVILTAQRLGLARAASPTSAASAVTACRPCPS